MNVGMNNAAVSLNRRQRLELEDAIGGTIVCLRGGVWITQHHDCRDIVLGAGERFVFDRPGLAIVQATADSLVRITERSQERDAFAWLRDWRIALTARFAA